LALLCDDLGLLYLCTAKTGSTSVSDLLLAELGGRWLPPQHIWDDGELVVDSKHSSLADLVDHELITRDRLESLTVALTVRNPFAWVLSGYRYRRRVHRQLTDLGDAAPDWMRSRTWDLVDAAELDFDGYVAARYGNAKPDGFERYVDGYLDLPDLQFLRIEHIDDELNRLLGGLGVGWTVTIPTANQTEGDSYRSVYSDRSRAIVSESFALDLDMFGYEF
jgi:hypothetical protein